jgi:hypothetical protein
MARISRLGSLLTVRSDHSFLLGKGEMVPKQGLDLLVRSLTLLPIIFQDVPYCTEIDLEQAYHSSVNRSREEPLGARHGGCAYTWR